MNRRLHIVAVVAATALAVGAAHAQVGDPKRAPTLPPGTSDNTQAVPTPNRDPGVITPPSGLVRPGNPDPGINVPIAPQGRMPVIPPPGTPGGNPNVQPR